MNVSDQATYLSSSSQKLLVQEVVPHSRLHAVPSRLLSLDYDQPPSYLAFALLLSLRLVPVLCTTRRLRSLPHHPQATQRARV